MSGFVSGAMVISSVISSSASKSAAKSAASSAKSELDFAKAQYADWQATYGDIQDNLSEYYNSITPEYYAATGLQAFQVEQQASMTRVQQNLAQRGLADSALAASIESQSELNAAETRAGIRAGAEDAVLQQQSNFLGLGLGVSPASSVSQALASQTAYAQQNASNAAVAAGQAWSSTANTIGSVAADYFRANPVTTGTATATTLPANSGIYTNTPY